ncbi:helix-turn-helix domain-containing protein [Paraburkholderia aspalathi]|nr:helix-turn-helix domain-containing protein [Paraburkholderia aspalathi]
MPPRRKDGPLTTAELAKLLGVGPTHIRSYWSSNGSYHGLTPVKTRSGRLLWPADSLAQLTAGGGAK